MKIKSIVSTLLIVVGTAPLSIYQAEASNDLSNSNIVFDWAEAIYPQFFSPSNAGTQEILGYHARYYSTTDTWLGAKDNQVYIYGTLFEAVPPVGNNIKTVGSLSTYLSLAEGSYPLVDTAQDQCYDNDGSQISCPQEGEELHGQDAQYDSTSPSYTDKGDGTISDNNTGLMWQQDPGAKMTLAEAETAADQSELAGHKDWRLPTIKELYSLMDFRGVTGTSEESATPYIDTSVFNFSYGDTDAGERYIDAQFLSSTQYVSTTMGGDETVFGVNFADGRIKGYPIFDPQSNADKTFFVLFVRGQSYGNNLFRDNEDGTITDVATGLTWMKNDSGHESAGQQGDGTLNWQEALAWCEDLDLAGQTDWRLPDAKELQGIVDYARSPDTSQSAAIDSQFNISSIIDGNGNTNYPYFWTGTSHLDGASPGSFAVYIAFGEALGYMESPPGSGSYQLLDVHGAGAQRSDPKTGDPSDYPYGHGPQGDVISIYNYARCVRGGDL